MTWFKKCLKFTNEVIAPIIMWFQIVYAALLYFGFAPYNISFERNAKIVPYIQQFPGQKIRLGIDPQKEINQADITNVQWELSHKNEKIELNDLNGFSPTIILPPEGGIYQIKANVNIEGRVVESNNLNFSVTQDADSTIVKVKKKFIVQSKVKENNQFLGKANVNAYGIAGTESVLMAEPSGSVNSNLISSKRVKFEILSKDNKWIPMPRDIEGNGTLESGTEVKSYNNKIFIRESIDHRKNYRVINLEDLPKEIVEIQEPTILNQ